MKILFCKRWMALLTMAATTFLFSAPARATIAVDTSVQTTVNVSLGGTLNLTTNNANEDVEIAFALPTTSGDSVSTVSGGSGGTTWTLLKADNDTTAGVRLEVWHSFFATTQASQTISFSMTGTTISYGVVMTSISGINTTTPVEASNANRNTSTTSFVGSVTTVTNNAKALMYWYYPDATGTVTTTAGSGYTIFTAQASNPAYGRLSGELANAVKASPGLVNPPATISSAVSGTTISLSMRDFAASTTSNHFLSSMGAGQ